MNYWIISGLVLTIVGSGLTAIGYIKQLHNDEKKDIALKEFQDKSLRNDTVIITHTDLTFNSTKEVKRDFQDYQRKEEVKSKQSYELEWKKIKAESPFVEVLTHSITFEKDSLGTKINFAFANTKNRNAINMLYEMFIVFKNIEGTDWGDFYHTSAIERIPRLIKDNPIGTHTIILQPYEKFLMFVNGSLMQITIKFYDDIIEEYLYYDLYFNIKIKDGKVIAFIGTNDTKTQIESFMNEIKYQKK